MSASNNINTLFFRSLSATRKSHPHPHLSLLFQFRLLNCRSEIAQVCLQSKLLTRYQNLCRRTTTLMPWISFWGKLLSNGMHLGNVYGKSNPGA
jgi:hypothetical protein